MKDLHFNKQSVVLLTDDLLEHHLINRFQIVNKEKLYLQGKKVINRVA